MECSTTKLQMHTKLLTLWKALYKPSTTSLRPPCDLRSEGWSWTELLKREKSWIIRFEHNWMRPASSGGSRSCDTRSRTSSLQSRSSEQWSCKLKVNEWRGRRSWSLKERGNRWSIMLRGWSKVWFWRDRGWLWKYWMRLSLLVSR